MVYMLCGTSAVPVQVSREHGSQERGLQTTALGDGIMSIKSDAMATDA